jgi:hypothetical protein
MYTGTAGPTLGDLGPQEVQHDEPHAIGYRNG